MENNENITPQTTPPTPVQPSIATESPTLPQPPSEPAVPQTEAAIHSNSPYPPNLSNSPKKSNKVLFVGILLLLIAIILGVGYFYLQNKIPNNKMSQPTPTPIQKDISVTPNPTAEFIDAIEETNETSNWKIFVDQGYSIKYPSNELFSQKLRQDESTELIFSIKTSNIITQSIKIVVSEEPTSYKNILEMKLAFSSYIKIGDYPSLVIYPDTNPPDFCAIYNLINNGQLYNLKVTNPNNPHGGNCDSNYLRQILSTLKFIDEEISKPEVTTPKPNSKVTSPLVVKGKVPPGWMFEGQFPIKLLDSNRNTITTSAATETIPGAWSSGKAVDFQATLTFTTSGTSGYLVLENDNPSGLPENSKSFEIPISF